MIEDGRASLQWGSALASPARVRVEKPIRGDVADVEQVMTDLDVVEGRLTRAPEGINALLGDRWHIRGHRLSEATVLPCRGSYRIARGTAGPNRTG